MSRTSRRQFAKVLTVIPVAAADLLAQPPPSKPEAKPLGKALTEVVKAQYRRFLNDEELERIGTNLQEHATLLETLRAFKLANADEPDVTFSSLTKRW